jgi:hypothetical protein
VWRGVARRTCSHTPSRLMIVRVHFPQDFLGVDGAGIHRGPVIPGVWSFRGVGKNGINRTRTGQQDRLHTSEYCIYIRNNHQSWMISKSHFLLHL